MQGGQGGRCQKRPFANQDMELQGVHDQGKAEAEGSDKMLASKAMTMLHNALVIYVIQDMTRLHNYLLQ